MFVKFRHFHYSLVNRSTFYLLFQELREDPLEEDNGEAEERKGKEKTKISTIYTNQYLKI